MGNVSDVVTRVRVHLKSGLESDFAGLGLGLGLRAERLELGLRLGSVGLGLGLGLERVTRSPSLGLPISLELVQRPLEKLNQLNNRNVYSFKNFRWENIVVIHLHLPAPRFFSSH